MLFFCRVFQAQTAGEYYRLAMDKYNTMDYTSASDALDKCLTMQPANDSALWLNGTIAYKTGNYKKAMVNLSKAIKLNKNLFDAFYTDRKSTRLNSSHVE